MNNIVSLKTYKESKSKSTESKPKWDNVTWLGIMSIMSFVLLFLALTTNALALQAEEVRNLNAFNKLLFASVLFYLFTFICLARAMWLSFFKR